MSSRCEVSHCGLYLHFPMTIDTAHLSMCFWPLVNLLWRNVHSSSLPFLELGVCPVIVE